MKLFADDTSLFTIVQDPAIAARDMNHDLDLIKELVFSRKNVKVDHPVILFNDVPVSTVDQHKHSGITQDSKLSFSAHIQAAIANQEKRSEC